MESSLKQRIYENILKPMENYRYIKSTAEATIPNFICTHSPSIFLDFQGVSAFSVLAVTPFPHLALLDFIRLHHFAEIA